MISIVQPNISKAQVQPCDIKARGITGTQLDVIGEQEIKFTLQSNEHDTTFVHTFLVSPLIRCSSGILGMDFLQRVGAEISLTTQLLYISHCSFPLRGQEAEVSTVQRLINAGREESSSLDPEEKVESVGDWEGTVELAETVTVPPFSVRIARGRLVRRDDSTVVKSLGNASSDYVLVDTFHDLPGIFTARVVAMLESNIMSSSNVSGLPPSVVNLEKSPLSCIAGSDSVAGSDVPPRISCIAGSDNVAGSDVGVFAPRNDGGSTVAGAGECLPELPDDSLQVATISRGKDLLAGSSSLPVENRCGKRADTTQTNKIQIRQGQVQIQSRNDNIKKGKKTSGKPQGLGYVPIHIANLSLEEIKLEKQVQVGVASPIQLPDDVAGSDVNVILGNVDAVPGDFEKYLRETLAHLEKRDRQVLEPVLRKYKHLFYGIGSLQLG